MTFKITSRYLPQFSQLKSYISDSLVRTASALTVAIAVLLPVPASANITAEAILHSFAGPDGSGPGDRLVQSADGSFFGTTIAGGSFDCGTVFKLSSDGTLTTLHSFTGGDGYEPESGLASGEDGNYYGTTYGGGSGGKGTIFKIAPDGTFTTLHAFNKADGASPSQTLTLGTDGKLYGTTYRGGDANRGTVFTVTSSGAFTTLYSFHVDSGSGPSSRLIQGLDGSFYGTAAGGGPNGREDGNGDGAVYKIDANGTYTMIYAFDDDGNSSSGIIAPNGIAPSGLSLGDDGNFYGSTSLGGAYGHGTIFKITAAGVLTTLGSNTANVTGDLIQAKNGNFYGTIGTPNTFSTTPGSVFEMTPAGTFTTLYAFGATNDGKSPAGGVMQGVDGALYGTTGQGGSSGLGTIFKLPDTPIQFTSGQFTVDEAAGYARIQFSRTGSTQGTVSVYLSTKAGTATRNVDYKSTTDRVITWGNGDASIKTTNIEIYNDTLPEPNETLSLVLTNPLGGPLFGALSTATLTILDDDTVINGAGQIQFAAPAYQADEAPGYARITLSRVGGAKGAVSALLSTTGGTAIAGTDYKAVNDRTIQWADGDASSKTTNIQLNTAAALQGNETVQLVLKGPTGGAVLGPQTNAVLTISPSK